MRFFFFLAVLLIKSQLINQRPCFQAAGGGRKNPKLFRTEYCPVSPLPSPTVCTPLQHLKAVAIQGGTKGGFLKFSRRDLERVHAHRAHTHTHTHTHTQKCERQEFCPIALAPTAAVTFNSNDYISLYATLRNAMPKSHHYGSPFTLRSSESRQF